LQICAIDVQSCLPHRFGESEGHGRRCYLVFDGIHYDGVEGPGGEKTFSPTDAAAEAAALAFVESERAKRQFPDTAGFTLRCLVCQGVFKGQAEAQTHAGETGHGNFGEF
jgi:ubiquitin thioesterase OTU1